MSSLKILEAEALEAYCVVQDIQKELDKAEAILDSKEYSITLYKDRQKEKQNDHR